MTVNRTILTEVSSGVVRWVHVIVERGLTFEKLLF